MHHQPPVTLMQSKRAMSIAALNYLSYMMRWKILNKTIIWSVQLSTKATKKEVPFYLEVITVISLGVLFGTIIALGLLGMTLAEYLQQFFN